MRLRSATLLIFAVLSALAVGPLHAQKDQDSITSAKHSTSDSTRVRPSSETPTFVEIELTAEGAIAYDRSGGRWAYDFDKLQFVSAPAEAGTVRRSEGTPEEQAPPVEVRCTELKKVDNPALSAVYVKTDEYVDGDIVAYSRVSVNGWVKGNVRSLNRAVLITSTGQVDGNVEAPEVEVRPGGRVLGEVIKTPAYQIPGDLIASSFSKAGLWVVFGFTLALAIVAFLSAALASQRLTNMTGCIIEHPTRSTLIGLLFVFLLPAIVFVVCVTIVGFLVVWAVPLAYFVAFAVGMCAVGFKLQTIWARVTGLGKPDLRIGSVVGIALYMGLWALTAIAWGSDDPAYRAGGLDVWLLVISILVTCYPLLVGIGSAVLTRFGSRTYVSRRSAISRWHEPAPAPAPPPIPEAPTHFTTRTPPPRSGVEPLGRPETGPNNLPEN